MTQNCIRKLSCFLVALFAVATGLPSATAQYRPELITRAERSDFRETARYQEVWDFTDTVAESSDRIRKTTFGYSMEGRALPLLVFGNVRSASAADVVRSGKTRIFIQANIHAGEVCGKEAILLLLRDLVDGKHASWSDSLVVLFAPIYNADGNERFQLTNRGVQNGPVGGMGQRPNAQEYDLNRDHMKLDSPEARSLARMLSDYDPHVVVDLHTTNGTHHGYHLTYSPPLHPNTPRDIDSFLRDEWLPSVTKSIKSKYDWDYYYYGNIPRSGEPGWYTFDDRPRFGTNYAGLRNRMAILSEAYAYLTFKDRVFASKYFVEEILDFAHAHAGQIKQIVEAADRESVVGTELALVADFERSPEKVAILMGDVEEVRNPYSGAMLFNRLDVRKPEMMFEYGVFTPTESIAAPKAYVIAADQKEVIERVRMQGIRSHFVRTDSTVSAQRFLITGVKVNEREYQGHYATSVEGSYESGSVVIPAGSVIVAVDQPLGRLAFSLLEPRADDGFLNWGLVELPEQAADMYYPIWRLVK